MVSLSGIAFFWYKNRSREPLSPTEPGTMGQGRASDKNTEEEKKTKFNWTVWEDPAGFSFEYPKETTINNHPEDKENYAWLELTKEGSKGKIAIFCKDSQHNNIDQWAKKDKEVSAGNSLNTTIASASAKKVALGEGKEIAAFIDPDAVIYTIKLIPENETYWQEIYRRILSSFKLIPLEGETQETFSNWMEGFNTSGADVVEPVEVIE